MLTLPTRLLPWLLLLCTGLTPMAALASAAEPAEPELVRLSDVRRGSLMFKSQTTDGPALWIPAPVVETRVDITVSGPIARTRLVQQFKNPADSWAEATYAFPLPTSAAVDQMRMRIGERIIEAEIQEKQQARKTFEQASKQGKRSALVEQARPNLFTTQVANIPPHGDIRIELEYQQELQWQHGRFSLRFPMAITPRYSPAPAEMTSDPSAAEPARHPLRSETLAVQGWALLPGELPHAADVSGTPSSSNTSLHIRLNPGFDMAEPQSLYHPIHNTPDGTAMDISLANGRIPADRDFVLQWSPRDRAALQAAWFTESGPQGDYGLLMLMPPQEQLQAQHSRARELTFVIDTSGSMGGQSIRAAQQGLLDGLQRLKPSDQFNLIEFNSRASRLFPQAVAAHQDNLDRARRWTRQLKADGGTEMRSALELALPQTAQTHSERLHQIVFITDGAVANEAELMRLIQARLGSARLFTVGIGSAPNAHFMTEAAHFGRGSFRYIAHPDEVAASMRELFAQLDHPALTDIDLQLPVAAEALPNPIPDLYAGQPLSVVMKLQGPAQNVSLSGKIGLRDWQQTLNLASSQTQQGLGKLWARRKITDWTRQGRRGMDDAQVREEILALALQHHLVSPYTSLVAVDKTPARDAQDPLHKHALKTALPAGMSVPLARGSTASTLLLLSGLGLLLLAWLARPSRAAQ